MFGYVRPDLTELKVKELERFRACYCGMCHELERSFGAAARFILNYDFVFLCMLLDPGPEPPCYEMRRCAVSPFRAKCVCCSSDVMRRSAGYSVILAYRKICDSIADEGLWGRIKARGAKLALGGAYKKAKSLYPRFDEAVSARLGELDRLEKGGETSLDRTADKFALLLSSAAEGEGGRVREHLLYHLGRIIYIADAFSDMREDMDRGEYNPVVARYCVKSLPVSDEVKEGVEITLKNSISVLMADVELLEETYYSSIIRNVVYIGVPKMCDEVLAGTYKGLPARLPKSENIRSIR